MSLRGDWNSPTKSIFDICSSTATRARLIPTGVLEKLCCEITAHGIEGGYNTGPTAARDCPAALDNYLRED